MTYQRKEVAHPAKDRDLSNATTSGSNHTPADYLFSSPRLIGFAIGASVANLVVVIVRGLI